jgi:DnaK suppressor protein
MSGTPDADPNPMASPIPPEQLDQIRAELERARQRLERSLKLTGRAARPVELDQTSVGRLSRMDALQNQHLTKGLEARESARYAQVQEALQRIEQGTYGVCAGCERSIPFERLLVFPETLRCAACGPGA